MSSRDVCGVMAAALLAGTTVFAQSQSQSWSRTTDQERSAITVVGCLQQESDYRRQNDTGQGGVLGTGAGLGNEYILVNAVRVDASGTVAADAGECSGAGGETFELTGSREKTLQAFVGRRVEIEGILKKAEREVGTSGTIRPEGGVDFLGRDLRLLEIEVGAFGDAKIAQVAAAAPPMPIAPEPAPIARAPEPFAAPAAVPEPIPAPALPKTATPLPLVGLLGLLSLAGALGLRALGR